MTLSANPTKWSNTLKQFIQFVGLALKGLKVLTTKIYLFKKATEWNKLVWCIQNFKSIATFFIKAFCHLLDHLLTACSTAITQKG